MVISVFVNTDFHSFAIQNTIFKTNKYIILYFQSDEDVVIYSDWASWFNL